MLEESAEEKHFSPFLRPILKIVVSKMEFAESDPLLNPRRKKSRVRTIVTVLLVLTTLVVVGLLLTLLIPPLYSNDQDTDQTVILKASNDRRGRRGNGPVVTTANGRVLGGVKKSREGREFYEFWNIPYAEPPVGQYRFQPPRKLTTKWEEVRDATKRTGSETECVQNKRTKVSGVEDCLRLHVMTPKLPERRRLFRSRKLPVMFYILGGAFKFGRANRYSAEYFMDEDVVLVTVEFRHGAFGYLNTEDTEIRGNMAFKDQAMALRWVRENIDKFGGDPDRITIFGNSSGGYSVHALLISPLTNSMIFAGISETGTVIAEAGHRNSSFEIARQLGRDLNCTDVEDTKALHQCLIDADPYDIASIDLLDFDPLTEETIPEDGDTSDVFMPTDPFEALRWGNFNKIPWILGANSGESYAQANVLLKIPEAIKELNDNWNEAVHQYVEFDDDVHGTAARSLRQMYFGNQSVSNVTRYNLIDLLSDVVWVHPVKRGADLHCKSGSDVYFYWFTHESNSSYGASTRDGFDPPYGVAHADEVQYLMPYDPNPYIGTDSPEFEFSKKMVKLWVSFAKYGKPRVPGGPRWPRLNPEDPNSSQWLRLDMKSSLMPVPERLKFLDTFPLRYDN